MFASFFEERYNRARVKQTLYSRKSLMLFVFVLIVASSTSAHADDPNRPQAREFVSDAGSEPVPYKRPQPPAMASGIRAFAVTAGAQTGGFDVDLSDRQHARAFYNSVFLASNGTADGFTGDVSTCDAGTTSQTFKDAVLLRVNYFRELAGVTDNIDFSAANNSKAQEAALMMSANNSLSHSPPVQWSCWTQAGSDGAGSSNLSYGSYGWTSVRNQMRDNGSNNTAVGHRRWILYPPTEEMGTGDIPQGSFRATNALWVIDNNFGAIAPVRNIDASSGVPYISWPPPGFVPYPVVFPRWSFTIPNANVGANANFSGATVTMTTGGAPVPVQIQSRPSDSLGNSLVWVPDNIDANQSSAGWPMPLADTTYEVTISNVVVEGASRSFSYSVTVFDPATSDVSETQALISGPDTIPVGHASNYQFDTVPFAVEYNLRQARMADFELEGAENGTQGISDGTNAGYSLISTTVRSGGAASFHLAHPQVPAFEFFVLEQPFLVSATSVLSFDSRLGFAIEDQIAKVQVSADDGQTWIDVYEQAGAGENDPGELNFVGRQVSLGQFANRTVLLRFVYEFYSGRYYPQTSDNFGFYVDNISVSDAQVLSDETVTQINTAGDFDFAPEEPGTYLLQVQYLGWADFPGSEWGPAFVVEADESLPPDADNDGVPDDVDNCPVDPNTDQANNDLDAEGDVCDADDDNDGIPDSRDPNPLIPDVDYVVPLPWSAVVVLLLLLLCVARASGKQLQRH